MVENVSRTVGIGILSFAGTNIDDLILLLLLFSNTRFLTRQIVIGQFLGISLIIGVSILSSFLGGLLIPPHYLRMLGLIPLLFGLYKLVELWKMKNSTSPSIQLPERNLRISSFTVAALTFTAGGDNIAVYTPLFLNSNWINIVLIISVYFVMTAVWCALALYLTSRKKVASFIKRNGDRIFPFILIAIGIYFIYF